MLAVVFSAIAAAISFIVGISSYVIFREIKKLKKLIIPKDRKDSKVELTEVDYNDIYTSHEPEPEPEPTYVELTE